MKKKVKILLRDLLFLIIFFMLIGILIRRCSRFLMIHKQSIIHELDDVLFNQLETTKQQCLKASLSSKYSISEQEKNQITTFIEVINTLETQYKKNSHGLMLLGPIGTISIVLKERKIKADLLKIITNLYDILTEHAKQDKKQIKSIEDGIIANQQLLF